MLKLFLKYQIRNKQAFGFPVILFTFFFIRLMNGKSGGSTFNPAIFGPVYMPVIFTNLIVLSKIPIPLYFVTNANMVRVVRAYNLTVLIWINVICIAINVYLVFGLQEPVVSVLQYFMITNVSLFIAFMTGNRISFSDLYTLKSKFWGDLGMNVLFVIVVIVPSLGLVIIKRWLPDISPYVLAIVLPATVVAWWFDSKSYKEITHFSYFISLNDNNKKRPKIFR